MMADLAGLEPDAPIADRVAKRPLEAVSVLLPIWGLRYVRQFLEFCLPTLLAPGNLPALARELPCTFVVMTHAEDEAAIRGHPAWRRLEQICRVEVRLIDDLITDSNHTTTITLAFARAVRESGPAMLRTLFIFLVSDYIVADGALASVLARIKAGASGVLAGNFQVVAEDAIPMLRNRLDQEGPEIAVEPRDLLKWTLAHLHPATAANIVNFGLIHNEHTNRLFWRVDESTLIGRFYLMHMIGIHPEVTDFVVGSSCDYSFIPELCPSNNVVVLTDSDDYLVVEMQPRHHEAKFLRLGPLQPKRLAASLGEWTTARHRQNVEHTVVYHAADIPPRTREVMAQAEEFIAAVRAELKAEPQPHRNHPYWIGAIAAHQVATGAPVERTAIAALFGERWERPTGIVSRLWRVRAKLFGRVPEVGPWHSLWPDLHAPVAAVKKVIAEGGRVLAVSGDPQLYARWLVGLSETSVSLEKDRLLNLDPSQSAPLAGAFDACLLVLQEGDLNRGDEFLARIGPLLKPGARMLMVVMNMRTDGDAEFGSSFAHHAARFANPGLWVADIAYVRASRLRRRMQRWAAGLARGLNHRPLLYATLTAAWGVAFGVINRSARKAAPQLAGGEVCSSVLVTFEASRKLGPLPPALRAPGATLAVSAHLDAPSLVAPALPGGGARSAISDLHCLETTLATYRFAANALQRRPDVCEVGRADALGLRLVAAEVGRLAVCDSDAMHLDALRRDCAQARTLELREHDVLQQRLPRTYDSIYSLRGLDAVPPEHEETFVTHIRESLSHDHDLLLIGCSAATAHPRAPAQERKYPRDGAALKALLDRHFNAVVMFSMLGDAIRPGLVAGASYFLALCCARKS